MSQLEIINKIGPNYYTRFGFNIPHADALAVMSKETGIAEAKISEAVLVIDSLTSGCFDLLRNLVQAQMSIISTEEQKTEPDLNQYIENCLPGVNDATKQGIIGRSKWLISKG